RDGGPAAVIEHLAEYQIIDRRPAPIGLCDPVAVDIAAHAPGPNFLPWNFWFASVLQQRLCVARLADRSLRRCARDKAAAEHPRLPRWRIVEHAGLAWRN